MSTGKEVEPQADKKFQVEGAFSLPFPVVGRQLQAATSPQTQHYSPLSNDNDQPGKLLTTLFCIHELTEVHRGVMSALDLAINSNSQKPPQNHNMIILDSISHCSQP